MDGKTRKGMAIEDRDRLNELLGESEARLKFAAKNSGLVVFNQDRELRYTWIYNPHPFFKTEEVIGKSDEELLPAEDAAKLTALKRSVLKSGKGARKKVRTTIDDYDYYYDLSIEPVYGEDQEIIGVLGSSFDVTYQMLMEDTLRRVNEELERRVHDRTLELLEEIAERKQMETELAEMQRRLMDSVESERTLLARELHDGPMQEIYAIMYRLAWLRSTHSPDDNLAKELKSIQDKLQEINRSLRSTSRDLRPATLSEFGLEKSIREHMVNTQIERENLEVRMDLMPDGQSLEEPIRLALYRIYQIAITNVVRHAQAMEVAIRLRLDDEFIVLEVEDDGCGFEVPKRWLDSAREGHLGLLGAFERAQAIGGELKVRSEPGKGTLVRVVVPR